MVASEPRPSDIDDLIFWWKTQNGWIWIIVVAAMTLLIAFVYGICFKINHPFPAHAIPTDFKAFENRGLNPRRMTEDQMMRFKYFKVT